MAPNPKAPAKPRKVQVLRKGTTVTIRWSPSAGAATYGMVARLTTGATKTFTVAAGCRAVKLTGVAKDVGLTAGVAGIRYDSAAGKSASVTLRAKKAAGGAAGKALRGKVCV